MQKRLKKIYLCIQFKNTEFNQSSSFINTELNLNFSYVPQYVFERLYSLSNRTKVHFGFQIKTNEQSESCYLTSYLWKISPTWPTWGTQPCEQTDEASNRLSTNEFKSTAARLLAELVLFILLLTTWIDIQRNNSKYTKLYHGNYSKNRLRLF